MARKTLSDQTGISDRTIARYEKGDSTPDPLTLQTLADELSVNPDYFYSDPWEAVPKEAVSFRRASRTSARKIRASLRHAEVIEALYTSLERHFDLPSNKIPDRILSSPSQNAAVLRESLGLGLAPIDNIVYVAEMIGVRVASLPSVDAVVDAFSFMRDDRAFIALNQTKTAERVRFDVAHELGHLVLHQSDSFVPSEAKEKEAEADKFASEFLMPEARVRQMNLANASFDMVLEAKRYLGVSAAAMVHRLKALDLISDWHYRELNITLSKLGYRSQEPQGRPYDSSVLLRQALYSDTKRIHFRELSEDLRIPVRSLQQYAEKLVPLAV